MKNSLTALVLVSAFAAGAHAQKPHTDRENEGLKGPVKAVVVERALMKKQGGQDVEGPRSVTERVTYDAEGNRVSDEDYLGGELWGKKEYRYVGGVQMADAQEQYPTIVIPSSAVTPEMKAVRPPAAPPMRHYTVKYGRKYDRSGNLIELVIEEDGRVRNRLTYRRTANRKETRGYVEQGSHKLPYRIIQTFDARGNLVELEDVNWEGHREKTSYSAYEFDERGNWVKRLVSDWETEGGKPRYEPSYVEYRTITYF